MVSGFTKFKERFQGFENQYVIIGGTACDLIMENEELPFRATKDVDIVLIVESITAEFVVLYGVDIMTEMKNQNAVRKNVDSNIIIRKKINPVHLWEMLERSILLILQKNSGLIVRIK